MYNVGIICLIGSFDRYLIQLLVNILVESWSLGYYVIGSVLAMNRSAVTQVSV